MLPFLGRLVPLAFLLAAAGPARAELADVKSILPDLRVYLDYDDDTATFAAWPVDKFGRKLPADQIARGARLGLSLWASVLPDMHFRFVGRAGEANLILRFGPYPQAVPQGYDGWGRAFLPSEWIDEARGDCGKFRESRWPDGRPCREWSQNIITFNVGRWTVSGADTASNLRHQEYLAWVFDRRNPHFRAAPDGPCVIGATPGAAWSDACVPFLRAPHHAEIQGVDLAALVQHEFGHTLLGDHTPPPDAGEYADLSRLDVLDPGHCVRLSPEGYSILFPGNEEKWWNRRGVFPLDIRRLKEMEYRVEYPLTRWDLILRRKDGKRYRTRDWSKAVARMIWPSQKTPLTKAQEAREYFLVDLERAAPE
jgi:hypothetical protein